MAINNLPNYKTADGFGMSLNIRRGNPNPLDNSSVWGSYEEALDYALYSPIAYVGQIISVINTDNSVDIYKIEKEGTLTPLLADIPDAMRFKGVVEQSPDTITEGYENGDVVIYGSKEYVWSNGQFVEFGDTTGMAEAITNLTNKTENLEEEIIKSATSDTLGRVKIGSGISVSEDGTISLKVEDIINLLNSDENLILYGGTASGFEAD